MKKTFLIITFFLSLACASIIPTPNDFPPPPLTVIVEFPNATALPTLALLPQLMTEEKMSDARTFFLILKTRVAGGDDYGVAESVKYPITIGGTLIATSDEFVANYDEIFNDKIIDVLTNTSDEDLTYLPEGIRVGHGEMWINLFCVDAACSDMRFLITQINH